MIRIGKVYENLMVDVNTKTNRKLVDRGTRMIMTVTGLERGPAGALLQAADGRVKVALVMHARNVDRPTAEQLLADAHGHVATIIKPHA
jgi:N-acetylmuramic acid 6-phosphate etherase